MVGSALGLVFGYIIGPLAGLSIGYVVASVAGQNAGALVAFIVVGAVIGAAISLAQGLLLRNEMGKLKRWVLMSSLGWAAGHGAVALIGALPIDALASDALGRAATGALFGLAQWVVLRQSMPQASWWVWANIVGWLIGPFLAGFLIAPLTQGPGESVVIFLVPALTGALGAVLTGLLMERFVRQSLEAELIKSGPPDRTGRR